MRVKIWNGSYITYADDTNLYWESTLEDIHKTLISANSVTANISKYCVDNCLRLNNDKCKYMFLGTRPAINKLKTIQLDDLKINNVVMERVSHSKVLGVTIDEVLSWRKNVNLCISKAMSNFSKLVGIKKIE